MTKPDATRIVFIDPGVANVQELLDSLPAGTPAFSLDDDANGLAQIADILAAHDLHGLTSVAIVGSGAPDGITLGASSIAGADLTDYAESLAALGAAMAPGGMIRLYGGLAAGSDARQFVDTFSALTGGTAIAATAPLAGGGVAQESGGGFPPADASPVAEWLAGQVAGAGATATRDSRTFIAAATPDGVQSGNAADGDPTGQLWIASSADSDIGHIDSDANGVDVSDVDTSTANEFVEVQLDSAHGLYVALDADGTLRTGHITNNTQTGQGSQIASVEVEFAEGSGSSDEVRSFAVDPVHDIIYFSLYGQSQATTGIIEVPYNPTTGMLTISTSGGVMTSPYDASNGTIANSNDVLLTNSSTLAADSNSYGFVDAGAMYYDIASQKLYYLDDDGGALNDGAGFDWNATENIYVVSTSGSVGSGNSPTPTALISGIPVSPNDTTFIGGMAVDTTNNKIYFTYDNNGTTTLEWIPIGGGTATSMTMPAGITLTTVADEGFGSNPLAIDLDAQQLYIAEENDGNDNLPAGGEIIRLSLNATGTGFLATGNTETFTTTNSTFDSGGGEDTGLFFYDLATLSGVSGTSTEAVQGGGSVTLLTGSPSVSDADTIDLSGATITVAGGQAGDELFVGGVQNGTVDSGAIAVSFDTTSHSLTLSGVATFSEYQLLLSEVTFQDTGTDTTSSGHHPTRTIDWVVSNGVTVASATTSDPNESQTTLTINRPPVQATHSASILEGNSIAVTSLSDSDLDGDTLTVTAVNGGSVGSVLAGLYGTITISGNDTYTYSAGDAAAINAAASGSHPVDIFTYTVSDGLGGSTVETLDITIDRPPTQVTHSASVAESGSIGTTLLSDSDPDGDTITVASVTGGTVGSPLLGTYGTLVINSNDTYTYSASDTTAINAAASGSHPTDSFSYTVSDGHAGTTLETLTIVIDRPPTMTGVPASTTVSAGGTVTLAATISAANSDGSDLTSATVQITGGGTSGDVLSATAAGTITETYTAGTRTLTLSGPDTTADFNAVLESVSFHTTGAGGTRIIEWTVDNSGVDSVVQTETLTAFGAPNWTAGSGDWDTAGDWSTDVVPTGFDDATISTGGAVTVTHGSGTAETVDSLVVGAAATVEFTSGSLGVTSGFTNGGTFDFDSGGAGGGVLSVGGTLTNNGMLQIGNGGITTSSVVSAAALVNVSTGSIILTGDAVAELLVAGAVENAGVMTLQGSSLLSAGGGITVSTIGALTVENGGTVLGGLTVSGGSVFDSGTIAGAITLAAGAYLQNAATITAAGDAVLAISGTGTVVNSGTIAGTGGAGVGILLASGGNVSNMSGGVISGGVNGVEAQSAGTIVNEGLISGATYGVVLSAGGTVATGGTIVGASAAVDLLGPGNNRLILYPGYVMSGAVDVSGIGNTLELGSAASVGTLTGLGTVFTNFATEIVDTGAGWTLSGSNTIGNGVLLTIGGTLADHGSLTVSPTGTVAGTLTVGDGGSAEFQGLVDNSATLAFGAGGTLVIDDLAKAPGGVQTQQFNAPVSGLLDGDKIRIAIAELGKYSGITAASAGAYNGASHTTSLYLTSGGGTVATLTLDGDYAGNAFGVSLAEGGYVTIGKQINSPTDFTGAGFGDVPFQYSTTEKVLFAEMSNGTLSGFGFATGGLGTFSVVGHGDINGDGISDVVAQNPSTDQVYYAEEDGSGSGNPNWVLGPDIPGFTVVGVGDIQGDDRDDLVMQNSSGRIVYYDTAHNSVVQVANAPGWNVAGVGDVNGDGYADIVIQNPTTGKIVYGDMAGGTFQGWDLVATDTLGWTAVAVADIQGDGYADVIVQNLTAPGYSHVLAADMQGGTFNGWLVATTGLTSDYVVKDTADVFGNGHADLIVQQQSTGTTFYAQEGASGFQTWGYVTTGLNSNFHVV